MAILKIGASWFQCSVDSAVLVAEELNEMAAVSTDYNGGFTPLATPVEVAVIFTKEPVPATVEDGCDAC